MIRIGSKRRRGLKGDTNATFPGYKNIDVTSGSMNVIVDPTSGDKFNAFTLSPIKGDTFPIVAFDGLVFHNFEMFWQANKVYKELGHVKKNSKGQYELTEKFFNWRKKWAKVQRGPLDKKDNRLHKRYLPGTRGIRPLFGYYNGKFMSYLESRMVYINRYCEKIKELPVMTALCNNIMNGVKYMILDGDGPDLDKYPQGMELTWENLDQMYKDTSRPFGHGYVVAAALKAMIEHKNK